ncbi:hypothetical protein C8R44DRAFT_852393 [Mycena epipterygia]|nr:hypothetical protein C8R44DRAFT_852393 [Mycena epipterygia]
MEIIQYTLQEIAWILVQPEVDRTPTADERSALEAASQSARALACALNEPGLLLPQGLDRHEFVPAGLPPLPRWPLAADASSHVPATDISSASRLHLPHAQHPSYTISNATYTSVSQARARPPAVPYPTPAQGGFPRVPERTAPRPFDASGTQAFGGHGLGNGAYFPTSQMGAYAIPHARSDISVSSSLSGALAPFPRVETATPYWDPSSVTPYMQSTVFRHHPPGPAQFPAPPQMNGGMHQARSMQVTRSRPKSLVRGQQYGPSGGPEDTRRRTRGYPIANARPTSPPPAFDDVWEFTPYELPPTPAPSSELQVASTPQPVVPPRSYVLLSEQRISPHSGPPYSSARNPRTQASNATGPFGGEFAQAFAAGPATRRSEAYIAANAKPPANSKQAKLSAKKVNPTSVVPPPVDSPAVPASGTSRTTAVPTLLPRPKHPVTPVDRLPVANLVASACPDNENHVYTCMVRESADGVPDTHKTHNIDGKMDRLQKHLELEHGFPILETRKQYKEAKRPFPEIACVWGGPSPEKRCEYRCSQDKMPLHIRKFHLRADWIRCLYCNEMFERKPDYEEHFWGCQEYLGTAVPSEGSSWKRRRVVDVVDVDAE